MTFPAAARKSLLCRLAVGVLLAVSVWVLAAAPAHAVNLPGGRAASSSQEIAAPIATASMSASIESSGGATPLEAQLAAAGVSIGSQYAIVSGLVVIGVALVIVRAAGRRRRDLDR
ncbi:hypothetical protein [Kineococcus rubinsiae]|uniref:hypothetical protein n=1 Tax=Kineococcus rubinsiae TaxID=2609562 RepID=UPI00143155F3|nr:hypothetical protein [Kineococcus rubinsiae]NIZ93166.1 hypothetical protein [Kineococcus rubinsiae]